MVGNAYSVLIREVSPIQSALCREVPLHTAQHNLLCGYTYRYVNAHVRHVCGATHCSHGIITFVPLYAQPHLSLWCLHNSELAKHFNECHLGFHICQSHPNAVSRSTPKWNKGTRVNGGLLGPAEPAAKKEVEEGVCAYTNALS